MENNSIESINLKNNVKVLYLFNGRSRTRIMEDIKKGLIHDGSVYGMSRMKKYDISVNYVELEKTFPPRLAFWLRKKVLNVYFDHIPFFFEFFKYDIVFSSSAFGSQLLRTLIPKKKPFWVMQGINVSGLLDREKGWRRKIFKWMVGQSAGIVTVDKKEAQILKSTFPRLASNIVPMLYPVDTDFFKPDKNKSEGDHILTVGVDPGRDYDTFLQACTKLQVKTKIATHPARLKHFEPLPDYIHVEKYNIPDLIKEYNEAKVFVLPLDTSSRLNDAMGCSTVVEAMAMGKAIVATRTPTMESFIKDGDNGLLVDMGDHEAMAEAINLLLQDDQLRFGLGKKARQFAVENCDTELFTKQLSFFFKQILKDENQYSAITSQ